MKGTVVTRPEQMTGLWESDDGSGGAVGINLRLITTIKGQPKTFAGWSEYWDSLQIGVYQRHGSVQNVGDANWIMDNLGGANFDLDGASLFGHERIVARNTDSWGFSVWIGQRVHRFVIRCRPFGIASERRIPLRQTSDVFLPRCQRPACDLAHWNSPPPRCTVLPLVVGELLDAGAVEAHYKDLAVRLRRIRVRCFILEAHP